MVRSPSSELISGSHAAAAWCGLYSQTRLLVRGFSRATISELAAKQQWGAGLGANVPLGGSNRTVALQPISLSGQTGLNLALGVAALQLGLPRQ